MGSVNGVQAIGGAAGIPREQPTHRAEAARQIDSTLKQAEEQVRQAMEMLARASNERISLSISVNRDTGSYVIRVLDANTGELIREVPPEEVLKAAAHILKCAGLALDRLV